ncbi:MAG: PRC-barrel domain-containing protein [bacterium]|nr:PRC-barrel domain-containing protein [bacterium]
MHILRNKMINLPIISIRSSSRIGETTDFLIDEKNLKIAAAEINSGKTKKYLLFSDIRNYDSTKILVNSIESLGEKSDMIRLGDLINNQFKLIGAKVETISGKKLGKVGNFSFEFSDGYIYKIYVGQNILKNILKTNLIIDRDDIIEVTKDKIIVRDAVVRSSGKVKAVLPLHNT